MAANASSGSDLSHYETEFLALVDSVKSQTDAVADSEQHRFDRQLERAKQLLLLCKAEARETGETERALALQDELLTLICSLQSDRLTFASLPLDAVRSVCEHVASRDLARLCVACRAASQCCDRAFRARDAGRSHARLQREPVDEPPQAHVRRGRDRREQHPPVPAPPPRMSKWL